MTVDHAPLSRISSRLHWYQWTILAASFALTLGAWRIINQQSTQASQGQFERHAQHIVDQVQERMNNYEAALWSGVAALHALPPNASRSDWRHFASSLKIGKQHPGVHGIGVIHHIPQHDVENYLVWMRKELPDFRVHPTHDRNAIWPISYVEPQGINAKTVGLDIAHAAIRYAAAKKSATTGTAQLSGPIRLMQGTQKTPGFSLYVPWYKNRSIPETEALRNEHLLGLVYAPFIADQLMRATFANTGRPAVFRIRDGDMVLYDELTAETEGYDPDPMYSTDIELDLFGRQWVFSIHASSLFRGQHTPYPSWIILIGGLLIDSLLLATFIVLARSNRKALQYADDVTEHLQKNESMLNLTVSRLDGTMNAIMDGVIVIDEQGCIQFVNSAIEAIFGCSKDTVVGENIRCLMPKSVADQHDHYLARKTPEATNPMLGKERKLLGLHADGYTFPIRLNVSKSQNEQGVFYTGVIHDLSTLNASQLELEKSETLLQVALFQSPTPMVMLNTDHQLIDVNPAMSEWLGYSYEALMEMNIHDLVAKNAKPATRQTINKLIDGNAETQNLQAQYRHKQGHLLWCFAAITRIKLNQNESPILFAQFTNIQPMKELEIELAAQNQHLQDANAELNQFSYIASHDLKEPLRSLRTFTTYLLKDLENEKWDRVAQDVYHVESAAERMTRLVNDLLDLSRAGNIQLTRKLIDSDAIFQDMQSNLMAQLEESDALLTIEGENLPISGNAQLLTQVMQNLVNNAIKFHLPEHRPEIHIKTERDESEGNAIIEVHDRGIGIAEEHLHTIFLAFKRLHSASKYPGTGIGLAIVKKIIDRHEGTIELTSTPGTGSCFRITLPLAQSQSLPNASKVVNG